MKTFKTLMFGCIALFALNIPAFAQSATTHNASTLQATYLGRSGALRDLPQQHPSHKGTKDKYKQRKRAQMPDLQGKTGMTTRNHNALPHGTDPALQAPVTTRLNGEVTLGISIEGTDQNTANITPPDPSGDVSPNYYVQSVNAENTILNVWNTADGTPVLENFPLNSLWETLDLTGLGDPIVLFDRLANRWLVTELGSDFGSFLIALSTTNDPAGAYDVYHFVNPNGLPDYPKFAIHENSYFITTNEQGDAPPSIPIYALDRTAMLNSAPEVDIQRLTIPKFDDPNATAFQVAAPVDWDGATPPPAGSPQYFVRIYDDAWNGGIDKLELWEAVIDWNNPNNSSITGPFELPTLPFDSEVCDGGDIFSCIAQPSGTLLSAIQQVVMNRASYRNFGTHETIILNHTVDVDNNNQGGIRWYELRKTTNTDWQIFQQGTYAPDDQSRFMGTMAMDAEGNIALGYAVTGTEVFPSLRFTGRYAGDPLGVMTITEQAVAEGGGENIESRWGDYFQMNVSPLDEVTFWLQGEYMKDEFTWGTRIQSFIIQKDTFDVGVRNLAAPKSSGLLTNSEQVKATFRNNGYNPISDFTVGYRMNDGAATIETVNQTLAPNEEYVHTFSTSVNMAALGNYNFLIFTSHPQDSAYFNDTLRTAVTQYARKDIGIIGITGIENALCTDNADIGIILRNFGWDTITSVNIIVTLNGITLPAIVWTGNLPFGQQTSVPLHIMNLIQGINTITATTANPNGQPDEITTNDSRTQTFLTELNGGQFRLELLTDNYPNETTWKLLNSNNEVLYEGGPYNMGAHVYEAEFCLSDGCYSFIIHDSFGDGLFTPGYYRIYNANNNIVCSIINNNFDTSEENNFCTDNFCNLTISSVVTPTSFQGAADGAILITASNGVGPFQYSINNGTTYQSNPLFQNLTEGTYTLSAKDDNGCIIQSTATITYCRIELTASITNATTSTSNDGAISIMTFNTMGTVEYSLDGINYTTTSTFNNLAANSYLVHVRDTSGCVRTLSCIIGATSSTSDQNFGGAVSYYPNPAHQSVQVNVHGLPNVNTLPVRLLDINGRTLRTQTLVRYDDKLTTIIYLNDLPTGTYFIHLKHNDFQRLLKLSKL